jgi:hypothetical protein
MKIGGKKQTLTLYQLVDINIYQFYFGHKFLKLFKI